MTRTEPRPSEGERTPADRPDVGRYIRIVLVTILVLGSVGMYLVDWIALRPARERLALRRAAEQSK